MFVVKITIVYYQAIFVRYCFCVNVTSPRLIPMHILMSLANKLPSILVCFCLSLGSDFNNLQLCSARNHLWHRHRVCCHLCCPRCRCGHASSPIQQPHERHTRLRGGGSCGVTRGTPRCQHADEWLWEPHLQILWSAEHKIELSRRLSFLFSSWIWVGTNLKEDR